MKTTTDDDSHKTTPPLRFPVGATFNPYKLFTGIFIPEALVKLDRISPGAKLCYGRLARYAGKNGHCHPSMETLGRELGVTGRQARSYVAELEEELLIKRIGEQGKVNHFQFLWHSIFDEPRQDISGPQVPRKNPSGVLRKDASSKESQGKESPDFDVDLNPDLAEISKAEIVGRVGKVQNKPKPAPKCKQHPDVKRMMASYMSGGGEPTTWPTDRQVVDVMKVSNGAGEKAVLDHLRYLFNDRGLVPDAQGGPDCWAWFTAVIKDAAENNKL